jgi:hypothetical protein
MTNVETQLPGSPVEIFLSNLWKAMIMFQWDNGHIWVHSIPNRPALDLISAALFSLGMLLLIVRYIKYRHWMDLTLLVLVPTLMLPSVFSLAFPSENPSLNRTGGAVIPVFIIVAIAVEHFLHNLKKGVNEGWGRGLSWGAGLVIALSSMVFNAQLVFDEFYYEFKIRAWNTSEIGGVIHQFSESIGDEYQAWVVPNPHWVDTRLVGINAVGYVRDYALWPSDIWTTESAPTPKLYIYRPGDEEAEQTLLELYPDGIIDKFESDVEGRDFMLYYVLE